jgi:hypothetical protein
MTRHGHAIAFRARYIPQGCRGVSYSISPAAIMTWTALPIASAGRVSPLGPLGISSPKVNNEPNEACSQRYDVKNECRPAPSAAAKFDTIASKGEGGSQYNDEKASSYERQVHGQITPFPAHKVCQIHVHRATSEKFKPMIRPIPMHIEDGKFVPARTR